MFIQETTTLFENVRILRHDEKSAVLAHGGAYFLEAHMTDFLKNLCNYRHLNAMRENRLI